MTLRIAPLRIAMIGLGDIARKAYLPVLGPRADVDLLFVTRNARTLADLGAAWRVERLHAELDTALAEGLDGALVHAATSAHPDIVRRLLDAGSRRWSTSRWPTTRPTARPWSTWPKRAASR
jgi:virulence factor